MWTARADAAPGTVTQVRAAAQALIRYAKTMGSCVILVGHVTKDGQIAGPRVVEHMVDAVASFEGDGGHQFRILRAVKNRFRSHRRDRRLRDDRLGTERGAQPIRALPLGRDASSPGTAVFAGMEGTRPVLVEIQALVSPTSLGTPRRAVVGWDPSRLAMVLAVLEAHGGLRLGQHDVLSQRRRRAANPGAGGGSSRGGSACLVTDRRAIASRDGLLRRDRPFRSGAPGFARWRTAQGSGEAGFFARAVIPAASEAANGDNGFSVESCAHIAVLVADIAQRSSRNEGRRPARAQPSRQD